MRVRAITIGVGWCLAVACAPYGGIAAARGAVTAAGSDPVQVSVQKPLPDTLSAGENGRGGAASPPQVRASMDADTVRIGDPFRLRIEITKDVMQQVVFPEFESGRLADSIEIVQQGGVDTLRREGRREVIAREYRLTCFTPGEYRLGRFPALYLDKNLVDTLWSVDSMRLVVRMPAVDTAQNTIYDIKPPMRIPLFWGEFAGYLIGGLLLALVLALLLYWIVVRRGRGLLPGAGKALDPPHVEAIKRLEKLHDRKLWQSGRQKEYYTELTDILRAYMGRRFRFQAMEMTSAEILDKMRALSLEEHSGKRLEEVLLLADYVKFAKYEPDAEANEVAYNDVYYFVEETKEQTPVAGETASDAVQEGALPLSDPPKSAAEQTVSQGAERKEVQS